MESCQGMLKYSSARGHVHTRLWDDVLPGTYASSLRERTPFSRDSANATRTVMPPYYPDLPRGAPDDKNFKAVSRE